MTNSEYVSPVYHVIAVPFEKVKTNTPSAAELSSSILLPHLHLMTVLNPGAVARSGLASFPFARRY